MIAIACTLVAAFALYALIAAFDRWCERRDWREADRRARELLRRR